MLDERKRRILQAITDDYISTAEPVGSRTIARRYNLGVSPATIRNEMADLEESGYLHQPHTSAGRIPSDKGYRYYVDTLMRHSNISEEESAQIVNRYMKKRSRIEELIRETSKLLAEFSNCVSVVLGPVAERSRICHIDFVPLGGRNILAVLISSPGIVENRIIEVSDRIEERELEYISKYLNSKLYGLSLSGLTSSLIREMVDELSAYSSLIDGILNLVSNTLSSKSGDKIFLDGTMNILEQPEFREVEKVKNLFSIFEQNDILFDLFSNLTDKSGVSFIIGSENTREQLKDCSVVYTSYGMHGNAIGTIGIIGPTRMNYEKVHSLLESVAFFLGEALEKMHE